MLQDNDLFYSSFEWENGAVILLGFSSCLFFSNLLFCSIFLLSISHCIQMFFMMRRLFIHSGIDSAASSVLLFAAFIKVVSFRHCEWSLVETTSIETQHKFSLRRVVPTEEVVDRDSQGSFQVASATNKPPSHKDLDVHCHNMNGITDEMFITIADSLHVWARLHQKNVTLWLRILARKQKWEMWKH